MNIEIRGLTFKYRKSEEAIVKDFNLAISKGEIISILGESGSGKSTVLRIIAGLEVPENGRIKVQEKVIVDDNVFVQPESRGIGMVFQDYALFPHMTVEENIKFGLKKMSNQEKNERVKEMLSLVNLKDYKARYPYELSGGQQQRVALARALAPKPSLLLLDEPFSNLDKDLQSKIRNELKIILKQTSTTTIFVTHDKEDALAIADRVVVLEKGQIKQSGEPSIITVA